METKERELTEDERRDAREIIESLFEVGQPFLDRGKPTPDEIPKTLYHFTDSGGAIGIIRDQTLWASRSRCLNDAAEIHHSLDLAKRHLRTSIEATADDLRRAFRGRSLEILERRHVNTKRIVQVEGFVVSLCPRVADSSHWLHYGRGGDGYALGFRGADLAIPRGLELFEVLYDPAQQRAFIADMTAAYEERILKLAEGRPKRMKWLACNAAAHILADTIWAKAGWMKNPVFKREREWRLYSLHLRNLDEDLGTDAGIDFPMRFRAQGNKVIPYFEIDYRRFGVAKRMPLTSVTVGSRVNFSMAERSLRFLLRESGYNDADVAIRRSRVPLQ